MAKLGKDESVPVETLEKVCRVLDCTIDIELVEMQFRIYLQEQIIWGKMRMNM